MIAPISRQIWEMKYRFRDETGARHDKTIEDSWDRVATALAEVEKPEVCAKWQARFRDALADFKYLPAGRILAGAGTARDVTLFNCFVMGDIEDSLAGIFENLKEAALTMQQGGGIGYDFSTIRPKGARVAGVGADASGPLSFMDVWDAMCRTIMSAGYRRGAMMATLRCDHPDIEDFITAKQDPGRLRMFNLSVLVSDAFMQAVKDDAPWDLVFGGSVYKTVEARDLWDKIMRSTYAYAEPGVIFIDRINARNNLAYCEEIHATNPCVTADTWVQTVAGPRLVADLIGAPFTAVVNGQTYPSTPQGFFKTGEKPVLELESESGRRLFVTEDHPLRVVTKRTRWTLESTWRKARDVRAGDKIVIHDHGLGVDWAGAYGEDEGYLIGLLIGDGTLKSDKAVLSVWRPNLAVGDNAPHGADSIMARAEAALRRLPHRADFAGWMHIKGRSEYRMTTAALKALAGDLGLSPGYKTVTPMMERASSSFTVGLLRGLFDCDGSVQGGQEKGVSVRLAQSGLDVLEAAQRMLLRLGMDGRIYKNRRGAGSTLLPDGQGGRRLYATRAQHELVIAGEALHRFQERIGFGDTEKAAKLKVLLGSYKRALNKCRFIDRVKKIEQGQVRDVYDVQIPGINAFDANGFYVHNCGEQPLPPYGACLLGSINLARFVRNAFEDNAHLDEEAMAECVRVAIRMMDNVVDASRFPLEAQKSEALAKRRIGLGVTGLADAFILCGVRYGGERSLKLIRQWLGRLRREAYLASIELAKEKGAFPLFERDGYMASPSVKALDEDVKAAISKHGIRNALLTSIAPTGTISLFADNISSGLEPVYAFTYTRKVLMPDGSRREETVSDYAYRQYRARFGEDAALPDYFVTALTLSPQDHLKVQAAVQEFIDSSISKTINCPEDMSFEAFKDVYRLAYDWGCKGCTTYRPNAVTGSVLEVKGEAKPNEPELPLEGTSLTQAKHKDIFEAGGVVYMTKPLDRPEVLPGKTYKVKWPGNEHAMYITINDVVEGGRRRPFEVFINSKNMEHYAWTVALTRMISAVFRRGGDVSFVVEELKAVFDPRGGYWMEGHYVPSILASIGEVIEMHLIDIGFIEAPDNSAVEAARAKMAVSGGDGEEGAKTSSPNMASCPKCAAPALVRAEGCDICLNCGYSKCG